MDYLGFVVELFFLGLGLYFLLLSFGKIKVKDAEKRKKVEAFFSGHTFWLRLLAIGLVLVMGLNLIIHLSQMLS